MLSYTSGSIQKINMKKTLLSAHRGGPEDHYAPNSLQAIKAVRTIGVDLIEFDVRVTKDKKFVTLHDESILYRGKVIPVEQLTSSVVLKHAKGAIFLKEMLKAIKGHAIAHVDVKDTYSEIAIVDMCQAIVGPDGFIITTLEDESVLKIRTARPHIQVALSIGRDTRDMSLVRTIKTRLNEVFPYWRIKKCDPTILALDYKIARHGIVRWAYRKHLRILLWTMNTPSLIEQAWKNPYIWAFTTNYPRKAQSLRPRRSHASVKNKHTKLIPLPYRI